MPTKETKEIDDEEIPNASSKSKAYSKTIWGKMCLARYGGINKLDLGRIKNIATTRVRSRSTP